MEYNQNLAKGHRPVYAWGHNRITSYILSPNRQRPLANAGHNAIFNTFRRSRNQFLYVVPPFVVAYSLMEWAEDKNHFYNSKPGRTLLAEKGEDIGGGTG